MSQAAVSERGLSESRCCFRAWCANPNCDPHNVRTVLLPPKIHSLVAVGLDCQKRRLVCKDDSGQEDILRLGMEFPRRTAAKRRKKHNERRYCPHCKVNLKYRVFLKHKRQNLKDGKWTNGHRKAFEYALPASCAAAAAAAYGEFSFYSVYKLLSEM